MTPRKAFMLVRIVHTAVWAFLVGCILAVPLTALAGRLGLATVFTAVVLLECVVLAVNHYRCPLSDVAARYTDDRAPNFDIYLPVWLAKHNKQVFGTLFVAGLLVLFWCSLR
jgi:hypothetical protein